VTLSGTRKIVILFGIAANGLFNLSADELSFISHDEGCNALEIADMNSDGNIDLIISCGSNSTEDRTLTIFLNGGDENLFNSTHPFSFNTYSNIVAILSFDYENEEQNELILCGDDSLLTEYFCSAADNNLECSFAGGYYIYGDPSAFTKGRFSDDDYGDFAVISTQTDTLYIVIEFEPVRTDYLLYVTDSYPTSIARMDFNNDGIDDIAVLTCNGTLNVFDGDSSGLFNLNYLSFRMNSKSTYHECCHSLIAADFNQDGMEDIVFVDVQMNSVRIVLSSSCGA
jgi:hypothetical protein